MSRFSCFAFLLVSFLQHAGPAQAGCRDEPDPVLVPYCRGIASDTIIFLRDRRGPEIEARLSVLPGLIAAATSRQEASLSEHSQKLQAHGYLRGRLAELEGFRALVEKQRKGMEELRTGLSWLRGLPESALPELLASLRHFLAEREELLDQELARREEELKAAPPARQRELEFALAMLRELKTLQASHPGSAADLLRRPLSKEYLEASISPFARALLAAALEADQAHRRAIGDLEFVEGTASRLAAQLRYEGERQAEAIAQLGAQVASSGASLAEAKGRMDGATSGLAALHAEREALRREREEIPGKVRHHDWMHAVGCARAHRRTVCEPDKDPNDWRPGCRRCFFNSFTVRRPQ